ncbi:hypothetical protein B0T10DRAFT_360979, partial [Thelonectria olida]
ITCDFLVTAGRAVAGRSLNNQLASSYCSSCCSSSIKSFQKEVIAGCGDKEYKLWENSTLTESGKTLADGLTWAHDLMCIKDDKGYCLTQLYSGNRTACSDCALKYGAKMVGSDFGREKYSEKEFKSVLSSCSAPTSSYPYTIPSTSTTKTTSKSGSTTTTQASTPTCEGEKYMVKKGDTCKSISKAKSVATDWLIKANHLPYSCKNLKVGKTLCIQDKCKLATIQKNQTCESFTRGKGLSLIQLQGWNPTLKSMCNTAIVPNLDDLEGRSICISPPGGGEWPTSSNTTSTKNWRLTKPMFTEWETGTVITSPTRGPVTMTDAWDPDFTPSPSSMTINSTLDSIIAKYTQDCWITEEDVDNFFDAGDLSENCQDLYDDYCIYHSDRASPSRMKTAPASCTPERTWLTTSEPTTTTAESTTTKKGTSTTASKSTITKKSTSAASSTATKTTGISTPSPIQTNMAKGCTKFYKVKSEDTCDKIIKANDITLEDFYKWNPGVGKDCGNLWKDTYFCI